MNSKSTSLVLLQTFIFPSVSYYRVVVWFLTVICEVYESPPQGNCPHNKTLHNIMVNGEIYYCFTPGINMHIQRQSSFGNHYNIVSYGNDHDA